MARNVATAIQNNFVGGFVTQATALNFPENAAFDQDNVVFSERGIVSRRFGFDYENNFVQTALTETEKVKVTYYWKNAGGDGNSNLVVQQNGDTLYFYTTDQNSLSAGVLASTITLSSFQSSGSTSDNLNQNECQFATGLGYLFVAHPYCDPFYLLYDSVAQTFTSSITTFTIRDTTGIPEAVLVDNRPGALTDTHKYNLYNQGWDSTKYGTFFTAAGSKYPSNADVWWIYKDSTNVFNPATMLANNSRGSTPAPKGFFRLNPWSTARATTCNTQAGFTPVLTNADETSGAVRPAVIEFHAGRVFYSGVNANKYNSRIYFSKIVQQPSDFGLCMSDNDPTSETLFDFLPSDGGIITIPQAGTIFRMISLGSALIIFGANGVWSITGSIGTGFTATDYTVSKIADTRSISATSFVLVDGNIVWWNNTGINILSQGKDGYGVKSLSDDKIKDFYIDLPNVSKRFARGAYNPRTHQIQWLYREADFASISQTYAFDSVITFNTLIGGFYTWSLTSTNVTANSILVIEGAGSLTGSTNIVDNSATLVVDNLGNQVITFGFSQTTVTTSTKFLVYADGKYTFAECFNHNYKDWVQRDDIGEDYTSFFITGYSIKTQGQRNFQTNYLFVFSDITSGNNSYTLQTLWDYANTGDSGKWSAKQLIEHTETAYDARRRKLKIRGTGTAVQFNFSSVSGLPFNIIGWSTYDTANQSV